MHFFPFLYQKSSVVPFCNVNKVQIEIYDWSKKSRNRILKPKSELFIFFIPIIAFCYKSIPIHVRVHMRLSPYECHWHTFPPETLWCPPLHTPPLDLRWYPTPTETWYPTPTATPPKGPVDGEQHGTTRTAAPADVTEPDGEWTMVDL